MGYRLEFKTGSVGMSRLRQTYQDREKYMAFCRECPRYLARWSCPPLSFDVDEFLAPFAWANLLCARIVLDEDTIREADTAEKVRTRGWEIVSEVKLDLEERLLKLEALLPGSVALSSGGCNFCEKCTRESGCPCRRPDRMRYSLDAFGFALSAITKDMFHIEILWSRESLPAYFTLIHGMLTDAPVPAEMWASVGLGGAEPDEAAAP